MASALRASIAVAGLGLATGGAISDHPVLAYTGMEQPDELAALLASIGFSALALGISDLTGPLFRQPRRAGRCSAASARDDAHAELERPPGTQVAGFVAQAGAAAKQVDRADLALVDPRAFEPALAFGTGAQLQRAE